MGVVRASSVLDKTISNNRGGGEEGEGGRGGRKGREEGEGGRGGRKGREEGEGGRKGEEELPYGQTI